MNYKLDQRSKFLFISNFFKDVFYFVYFIMLFVSCTEEKKINSNVVEEKILFPVRIGNNWGICDTSGNFILQPEYEYIGEFVEDLAIIVKNKKYAYVKSNGKIVCPFNYNAATDFKESKAIVLGSDNKIMCIDTAFRVLFTLPDSISETSVFSQGLLAAKCNEKYGYFNEHGKLVIPFSYCIAGDFREGMAPVAVKNLSDKKDSIYYEHFYINTKGDKVFQSNFKDSYSFSEGIAAVQFENGKWGWIDKKGKTMFQAYFDECKSFSEGFASFKLDRKWGLINSKGKIILKPSYDYIGDMRLGMASVMLGPQTYGYIDTTGKITLNPLYKIASSFYGNYAFVVLNEKISVISKNGKIFCKENFDGVPNFLGVDMGFVEPSMNLHLYANSAATDSISMIP